MWDEGAGNVQFRRLPRALLPVGGKLDTARLRSSSYCMGWDFGETGAVVQQENVGA